MLSFKRFAALGLAAAGMVAGQPALTTIQDILYLADGTRYTGTMYIAWNSFQAGDTSNIATASLTLEIVNGVLNVQLAPTTTASAGAQYNVTYNSQGVNQFTQVWAVPPSAVTLQLRDVLVSTGTVIGPAAVIAPIQITDVVNLQNELAARPAEGTEYAIGRAAIIDAVGQIGAASGNLGDCVRVDGSSGPCGGGGGVLPSFSDGETPTGLVNGLNTTFTLAFTPSPAAALELYLNGLLMAQGVDYNISGNTITFLAASTPQSGDELVASYRYANPSNPLGALTSPQVICSSVGASTMAAALTQLGSCTIPAGLLGTGDRIEAQFQFTHTGSSAGFTGALFWGGATVLSRTGVSTETALAGRAAFGVGAASQTWDAQSWGSSLSLASAVGTAAANTTQSLTVSFQGQMSTATSDSVTLNNFTVIRYPAQTNP